MNDLELGKKVFKSFYNWSRHYYPKSFNFSFDQFLKSYQPNEKKLNIILDGIGGGIREARISDARVENAMMKMAIAGGGKMPANYQDFFKYLTTESVKINWIDATKFVVIESTKDVLKGAQSVGDSLIFTGKILNFILPAIALIFVFFWINKKTEGGASKFIGAFKR